MSTEPAGPAGTDGSSADEMSAEGRLPSKISRREIARVVIKITGVADLLERSRATTWTSVPTSRCATSTAS